MNRSKLELFKTILTLEQQELHDFLYEFLQEYYTETELLEIDNNFLFARGDIKICLVAHLDTVHRIKPSEESIFYDQEKYVMWSPHGIGGDDRCGVFIIINLIMHGYKPYVLFTWNEEVGGLGAKHAAETMKPKLDFLIQFDRRGSKEAVYYDLDAPDFEDYINSFGFETKWGTYTDICELAPEWGCAAVNLSAGYDKEHTSSEMISLLVLNDTLQKAAKILEAQKTERRSFPFVESTYIHAPTSSSINSYPCYSCQKLYFWESLNDMGICTECQRRSKTSLSFYKKLSRRELPYDTIID